MTRIGLLRLLFILSSLSLGQAADICYRGSRLYTPWKGPDVCLDCQHGQFMPVEFHTHRQCFPCTKIETPQLEIFVSPCNRTHDTEIRCIGGYYRTQPSYPENPGGCRRCSECQFPIGPCQTHRDTVCCPGDDYGVYINKDGHPECVRECGPGQIFDVVNDQCQPCPENSYMDERKHINNYCRDCESPKSKKEVIVQPCNATHPTVLGCIDGYYRQSETMTGSDRGECVKLCQKGQYLDLQSETCQSCTENTYMDEDMHRFTDKCKQCDRLESVNERVLQPCNRTHPAVTGCVEGFYRQLSDDLSMSTCIQCRNCSENKDGNIYQGRACGLSHDTVCCPQPGMDVVDTLHGPECILFYSPSAGYCGEGEYLSTDVRTHVQACLPCPQGTYMDSLRHTNSSCISCKEFPHNKFCPAGREANDRLDEVKFFLIGGLLEFVVTAVAFVGTVFFVWYRWFRNWDRKAADDCETVSLLGHFPAARPGHWTMLVDYITSSANQQLKSKQFISISDFNFTYLPVPYTSNEMVDLIRLQAQLTVLVHVNGASPQRPKYFPDTDRPYWYSDDKYRRVPHTGSGWVHDIRMYKDQPCPCETCRQSAQKAKSWGEIVICTAAKVVFDITESKNCQCYFFYDTDDTDLRSCHSLNGALKVLSETARDWCYMTFATHDEELLTQIHDIFTRYHASRREVHVQYKLESEYQIQPNISDNMIWKLQEKYGCCLNDLANIKNRNRSNGLLPYQSLISLSSLLDVDSGDKNDEYLLDQVLLKLDASCHHARDNVNALQNEMQDSRKKRIRYQQLHERADEIERFLQRANSVLDGVTSNQNIGAKDIYKPRVDPTHNLTVIVSHPLGHSKQISVGYATGLHVSDHYARYRYTNALVRGCEGARVFIIGRTRMTDHGHSSRQGWSGSWSDLVPAVADLSVAENC